MKTYEYITCAAEKKLNELENTRSINGSGEIAYVLLAVLNDMKERDGFSNMTIRQISRSGERIDNRNQIKGNGWRRIGFESFERVYNNLTSTYPDFINYSNTFGLDCLTFKDFNGLVNAVYTERFA